MEFLNHAISLDLVWIVSFIGGNIHWFFALFAFAVIAGNGKRPVWRFLIIVALLWALVDVKNLLGLATASVLLFLPLRFVIGIFLEGTSLHKHELKLVIASFFALAFVNTFFIPLG